MAARRPTATQRRLAESSHYLVGGGGLVHDDMLDALAFSQNPEVQKVLVWPRPTDATDPNNVLRRYRAQHRARGGTWAGFEPADVVTERTALPRRSEPEALPGPIRGGSLRRLQQRMSS